MKRTWIGKYVDIGHKGEDEEFAFRIDADLNDEMSFTGTVWEEEFYEKTKMFLTVKGFINKEHISFVKSYPCLFVIDENFNTIIDKNQKGHEVVYNGYWNNDDGIWEGNWEVKGDILFKDIDNYEEEIFSGPFEMKLFDKK